MEGSPERETAGNQQGRESLVSTHALGSPPVPALQRRSKKADGRDMCHELKFNDRGVQAINFGSGVPGPHPVNVPSTPRIPHGTHAKSQENALCTSWAPNFQAKIPDGFRNWCSGRGTRDLQAEERMGDVAGTAPRRGKAGEGGGSKQGGWIEGRRTA